MAVTGRTERTYRDLVRVCRVRYSFADDPNGPARESWVGAEEFARFDAPRATAQVGPGAFGWAWVRRLEPPAAGAK